MSSEQDLDTAESAPTTGAKPEDAESPSAAPSSEELTDEQLALISGGVGSEPPPMGVYPT
jgi:bacteriocin-like protein